MTKVDITAYSPEERLRFLVNSVTDYALYVLDPEGRVMSWNPGAERFKGYLADEIIGQSFSVFFTLEDQAAARPAAILRTAREQGRHEEEGWRVRKDGSRFRANAVIDPIYDDGQLIGFAKITRDVTAAYENRRALFESEQRFRILVEGVRDYAIYMLDTNGRISNWNLGAQAIKGYHASEIVGQHFSIFYTPDDRAIGEPANALKVALNEGKYETEALRLRKDGTPFWAHVVIDPIHDEHGAHVGYAKITRDITQKRAAEQEVDEARAALNQAQRLQAIGELTGGIAHDFNNLMTVVLGSAEMMLNKPNLPMESQRRYLEAIVETAQRASTLTRHLLAFGRRQPLKPQVVDLNLRLDALADILSRTLDGRIQIEQALDACRPLVELDPAEFETALLNAAFNARDAMPDGGMLTLATRDGGATELVVEIRDTGTGMPPEVAERAFDPFFTTKPVGKGTGLGLSQIHGFAAQAGGRAEIETGPGVGTTIRLVLPRTNKPPVEQPAAAPDEIKFDALNVLLVEDDAHVREFAMTLLTDLGCQVAATSDAPGALARLGCDIFDLVFSDIVMPGQSGLELADEIRRRCPDLPVLLASGYSDELLNAATTPYPLISKPYNLKGLRDALTLALNSRS